MKVTPSFRDLPTSFLKNGHIVAGGRKPEKADFTINLLFSVMICVNCEVEFIWHSQLLTSLTTSQAVEQKLLWYLFGRHRFASLSGQPLHFRVFLQSFSKKKKNVSKEETNTRLLTFFGTCIETLLPVILAIETP